MSARTECVLTIDVGTSALKAALFGLDGRLLGKESVGYSLHTPQPNHAEQDPQDWWKACCRACRALLAGSGYHVLAACVSGQAPGCAPVRLDGNPVRPAILWLDRRAAPQAAWLQQHLDLACYPGASLNTHDSYFGGVKWLWYRQHEPENWRQTWKLLQANSFLVHRLTGEAVTDSTHAGICSPCFDHITGGWSSAVCALLDIAVEKLPPVRPSAEVVGVVTPAAAQECGVPAGTPVACGAADFTCAHLGSGAGPGEAALMLGTAGNLMALAPGAVAVPDRRMLNTIYFDGSVLSTGGVLAGAVVSWFVGMLGMDGPDPLAQLEREAADVSPGAANLLFLPYLAGERSPLWDPDARGVFFGLSPVHGRGHLYRAVLEGVAHAFRQLLSMLAAGGTPVNALIAINGGARSPLWRQVLADVTGLPLRWRPSTDGTGLGAAALAAQAAGAIVGLDEISGWLEPAMETLPDAAAHAAYARPHMIYCDLYGRLKDSFKSLQGD